MAYPLSAPLAVPRHLRTTPCSPALALRVRHWRRYVTAVWAAVSQQTRVIRSTCAPQYDETLYFPTNLVRISASELEAKVCISLDLTAPRRISPRLSASHRISPLSDPAVSDIGGYRTVRASSR